MELTDVFSEMPFAELLGIELTAAEDGHAEGFVEMREELSSVPGGRIAHGGVQYALADTVGGAAVISLTEDVTPTVDMRIDYMTPATDDLFATADVRRLGGAVAVADVDVRDAEDTHVASARGVYKTGGDRENSPWGDGRVHRNGHGDDRSADR